MLIQHGFFEEGKTVGSLKWSRSIDELKSFTNKKFQVDANTWIRNGEHNGEPYGCKLGDDIIIRW